MRAASWLSPRLLEPRPRRAAPRRRVLLAGLVGSVLVACGNPGGQGSTPSLNELLTKVQAAPYLLAYSGIRRVEHYPGGEGGPVSVVYTEAVASDGQGQYAIQPLNVLSDVGMDPLVFGLIQERRAGYIHRYRDFLIRDLGLFASNYQLVTLGTYGLVAGRVTWDLELSRKGSPAAAGVATRLYRVSFDLETGLVLAYQETDSTSGAVLTRVAFESIDLTPDFSSVSWHQPSNAEVPVDLEGDLVLQLGFAPYKPQVPPEGYQLQGASRVEGPTGRVWLKLTYCDGVESVFFLQGAPAAGGAGPALPGGGTPAAGGISVGATPGQAGGGPLPAQALLYPAQAATVVQADFGGQDLIAVGKVDSEDLVLLLQSALP